MAPADVRLEVVVPRGRLFVMGDHRDASQDSRCHLDEVRPDEPRGEIAFVPQDLVVGPASAFVSPFDRTRRFRTPATFDDVPGPAGPAPERAEIRPEGVTC